MSKAESVIFAGFFFALFTSFFGFSVASPGTVNNSVNQLLAGPPSFAGIFQLKNCSWYDINCLNGNVATATAAIALAAAYPAIFIFWFFNKIAIFFGFISIAILGPQQAASATPFLALFWGALFVYVAFEIIKIFRGNAIAGA